ncbi:bifunctional methylenetetrahydrofolate dehydrogenase/methenyltetrahydrofolate cyclohydrolase FolD [Chitinophaga pendula]|uniref:bifunctional methylenetetrahydrofolate dehydrogenase/methenyltetrahydrofolate cyclohydrolase FolD n=1 Tax=Chitinophaga TaxID=79328 RepID=UPI000BAF2650|nr:MULTISPECIES: bifunctional methylenetetrahydrofolate dehydrogenase/methenyltetrahydrofolate cyclohydrolase FolD [Chitinophaga]ASZ14680.1 bifunctional methylenetetrahydrofolate dehydrogenase/methenyltetrahydrofolate cyclohydrolase FolD [Chitinophaga sp. MD30]UCJ07664.1 bifunctional methylenetetrahydrofolate dehydrogenase/methenyltetrahydrofolate cyclohydrolase FolD [Chitinophaga pendula]
MQIIDGKLVSEAIKAQLATEVAALKAAGKKVPHLAAILIGNDGASETYVASKVKSCAAIGYDSTLLRFDAQISEKHLLDQIALLNENPDVDGILVQLPLPKHINEELVINAIDPSKDVDGFHPVNVGKMVSGLPAFIPATPYGIMLLLEHYNIPTKGKHAVVIGRSHIVGTPISILLSRNSNPGNCTVTLCHSQTANLAEICREADIIVAAIGRPNFVTGDMVKEGAVIVDVGINRVADESKKSGFRLVGDVNFAEVSPKVSFITPVPGGVGPMTIAALLKNTYQACIGEKGNLN